MFNIVLYAPEIPANTGNIGRTCVVTGARLHLVEPLGFSLDDKTARRAGLGYWQNLDVTTYAGWEDFLVAQRLSPPDECLHLLTKKARRTYAQSTYATATTWSLAARARAFPSRCSPRRPSAASASLCCAIATRSITPRLGSPRGIARAYRGRPRSHPSAGHLRQLRQSGRLPHQRTQPLQQRRHRPLRSPAPNRLPGM